MQASAVKQLVETGAEAWNTALEHLHHEYGDATYKSWFSHLKFQELKEGVMTITAPSRFIREWILTNYFNRIKQLIQNTDPRIQKVDLRVKPNRAKHAPKCITNDNHGDAVIAEEKCDIVSANLDPRFTFDNFVCGPSNKVAYSAAKAIAEGKKMPTNSNILYIHSQVGMGKTHLLQAIAAYIRENYKRKKVAYLSAEKFMHLYVKSIKNNDLITFKEKLRNVDVLLVDDLQFICGKNSTQQEFANTFNALTEANKKVVVSCDVSPYSLNLDTRSRSRLAGGLVADIKPADIDLRVKILKSKSENLEAKIPEEIVEFIANSITSSIRELEGALHKLVTHTSLVGTEINLESTQEILRDNLEAHEQNLSVDQIIDAVAQFYDVKTSDILSKSRAAKFVLPRQVSAFLAKQLTEKSLQEIGHNLGGRDHATVIYSIKKLEERTANDKAAANDIAKIMDLLGRLG